MKNWVDFLQEINVWSGVVKSKIISLFRVKNDKSLALKCQMNYK